MVIPLVYAEPARVLPVIERDSDVVVVVGDRAEEGGVWKEVGGSSGAGMEVATDGGACAVIGMPPGPTMALR